MNSSARAAANACLLSMLVLAAGRAQATGAESVTGLWAYETSFPVGLAGELTVTHRGSTWQGSISGATAEVTASNNEIRIAFPNEGGSFRGYLTPDGRLIRGYWARREITDDPRYPEGAGQAYAMPLALRPAGADRWTANVTPLPDPFTLYLNIFRDETGALKAAHPQPRDAPPRSRDAAVRDARRRPPASRQGRDAWRRRSQRHRLDAIPSASTCVGTR